MDSTTNLAPTPALAKPTGYLDNPLVRHLLSFALAVVLSVLASRYGIVPAPAAAIPFATPTPAILVIHSGGAAPTYTPLAAPPGK